MNLRERISLVVKISIVSTLEQEDRLREAERREGGIINWIPQKQEFSILDQMVPRRKRKETAAGYAGKTPITDILVGMGRVLIACDQGMSLKTIPEVVGFYVALSEYLGASKALFSVICEKEFSQIPKSQSFQRPEVMWRYRLMGHYGATTGLISELEEVLRSAKPRSQADFVSLAYIGIIGVEKLDFDPEEGWHDRLMPCRQPQLILGYGDEGERRRRLTALK